MMTSLAALLLGLIAQGDAPAPPLCQVTDYGAVADDARLDDAGLEAAMIDCARSGGTVVIPRGVFVTGGVNLRSGVTLHLAGGAVLRGSSRLSDYRTVREGERQAQGVVTAVNVEDAAITGSGTIDGSGGDFWTEGDARPEGAVVVHGCRNLAIRGVTVRDPARYNGRMTDCDGVVVDGITIRAPALAPNSDGLQIRDSADVRISNCDIITGDDAIVLKASHRPVERILITNCRLTSDDAAIKFGTGSRTVTRHVTVTNTVITDSRYGIALFMQDGGVYEDSRFTDLIIQTGSRHVRDYPIFVDVDSREGGGPHGTIRNITFDGLDIRTGGNILIGGQADAPVTGLTLSDIRMTIEDAIDPTATTGKPRGNRLQAQRTGAADFSGEVGHIVLGHAQDTIVRNVRITETESADRRPALVERETGNTLVDLAPGSGR
ncbi:glycoside hydrolase family 28 protein [Brevundimonas aurifodinae]|uniref:Glycosyl hydrolase family 28 protein n=2 Tax=Brevundimonas TaxID=41275 RepID=A0ABV1NMR4_9CAUL|nr:MAG: hypothetical protein B7Z42_10395 [Brevundimonas sp. 12-68-7]OYX36158.1 MAG: hypothetical protein B7Z01_00455 [Brevundimonas subvibrioides]